MWSKICKDRFAMIWWYTYYNKINTKKHGRNTSPIPNAIKKSTMGRCMENRKEKDEKGNAEVVTFSDARLPVTRRRLYQSWFNVCVAWLLYPSSLPWVQVPWQMIGWINAQILMQVCQPIIAFLRWNTSKSMKILIWTCQCNDFLQNSHLSFNTLVFEKLGAI